MEKIKSCYIHIPFCDNICSYCDFKKILYEKQLVKKYLDSLKYEIDNYYKGEELETLYIGGGTPSSLDIEELKYLFDILKKIKINGEFTFECNVESLTEEKLKLLYENNVNRLSIGVQTTNLKLLKLLNRNHTKEQVEDIINKAKNEGFKNINIDLIYAIPKETINDLKNDLEFFNKLNINHISTYSLMIEPHTKLYINKVSNIDQEKDLEMYEYICKYLKDLGFNHYEISNFSKNSESIHNLTYWNNKYYYGFGLSASGYYDNKRYTNTFNLSKYINKNYERDITIIDKKTDMENTMILGLRKLKGVSLDEFKNKFGREIQDVFDIKKLVLENKLIIENGYIRINENYIYLSNQILIEFLL